MKIVVYGLGYVGLTSAVCLAHEGHDIFGVDVSEDKVRQINAGISPIGEPNVGEFLTEALTRGRLRCSTHSAETLHECDMAIVCVGTPSGLDGAHNLSYIAEVSRQIASGIANRPRSSPITVVYRSTVRPGTIERLITPIFESYCGHGERGGYELVYNPEFLREAVAIQDFYSPPKIVIGTCDGKTSINMEKMNSGIDAPVFYTKYREAEMTKFVDNSFHALKVSFANEIGRICQHLGVDVTEVHKIFTADVKLNISTRYLRPGGPFGGSCLPKDVRALQHIAGEVGANAHVIDSLLRSNEAHKLYVYQSCVRDLAKGSRVLLLGLAFKANSDDLRESPNVYLARRLVEEGFRLSIYDPVLRPETLRGQNLGYAYTHLPTINELMVSRKMVESDRFDLVINASGLSEGVDNIKADRFVDITVLH